MTERAERIAKKAGLDLTTEQVESLEVAIVDALDRYERALQSSQGRTLARKPGSGLNYEAFRKAQRKFERWQEDWKGLPVATRRHLDNHLGLKLGNALSDGVAECEAMVAMYGPPKDKGRRTGAHLTMTRRDRRPGGTRDLEPLRKARVALEKWWTHKLERTWSPQFRPHSRHQKPNAEAALFLEVARECSAMLHGKDAAGPSPRHDIKDCMRALK